MNKVEWHANDINEVLKQLNCSVDGLSSGEALIRLRQFGHNIIKRKKSISGLKIFFSQVNNPLIWVLIAASVIAVLLGKITDGLVVLSVVIINTIIGFIQEFKAGKAIEALSKMVPQIATVVRDSEKIIISVAELVPGDVVLLAAGDRVPADMRIIQQKNLQVEESALTGESLPVQKQIYPVEQEAQLGDRTNMVFGGTLVTTGTATVIVVSTGDSTELGRISGMLEETIDLQTPLGKNLEKIGKYLTIGIIIITLVILAFGTYRAVQQGVPLTSALKDTLIFAIALAVGAIPEGLPAVITIALAIGVQRMAKRKAIIRKLPAVETLGSTTIICTDKTGTLTRNEMTVTELWAGGFSAELTGEGYNPEGSILVNGQELKDLGNEFRNLLYGAVLCNDAEINKKDGNWKISGDPTEAALLVSAVKVNINYKDVISKFARLDVVPFESENQFMATLNLNGPGSVIYLKGAPEVIAERCGVSCNTDGIVQHEIFVQLEKMSKKGLRVLAVAQKRLSGEYSTLDADTLCSGFSFTGLIGMIDPPRSEAIESIKKCHSAGIVVKMITGDHKLTARTIGMQLGLSETGEVITGAELSLMDDATLIKELRRVNIFARVAPEHKLRIVRALQIDGQIVAMTGDGVNDAPSLKQSNIGIAMGITGSSVSKESADIVLADDNFSSISAAVEEGRRVYDNLLKSLAFLLPTNLGLALILIYGIMFFPFNSITKVLLLPMLPTQLLWINLVAAIALALPLAFEVKEPNIMHRPPRKPEEPLFSRFITFRVFFVSIFMTLGTIIIFNREYAIALSNGVVPEIAISKSQTIAVTFVIMFQIFYLLNCRSLNDSLLKIGIFSNYTIYIGIGSVLLLQVIFIYTPFMQAIFGTTSLGLKDIAISVVFGLAIFPFIWFEKWIIKVSKRFFEKR